MTSKAAYLIICIATAVSPPTLVPAQVTVDASGPVRETRRVVAGQVSGIGRKLSVEVAVKLNSIPSDDHSGTEVIFVLTNTGKNELSIPVSPHRGDFDPIDPNVGYTILNLGLRINSFFNGHYTIFPGGANLYGKAASPSTIVKLASGKSIEVRCRVTLPNVPNPGSTNDMPLQASAILNTETVTVTNGRSFSDSQNIGSAFSREFSLQSLK